MSGLIYKNECIFAPGEVWDRITIVELKILHLRPSFIAEMDGTSNKIKMFDKLKGLGKEWNRLYMTLAFYEDNMHGATRHEEIVFWVNELRAQNAIQWKCEDRVRTEESWEAAKAARDSNNRRTHIKNKINKIYGHDEEIKDYAGE